jgi:Response regulator receiver domain
MHKVANTILVIDHEKQIRRFITAGLELHGYSVSEADNGVMGLSAATVMRPDLIILDPDLSDMNGPTLAWGPAGGRRDDRGKGRQKIKAPSSTVAISRHFRMYFLQRKHIIAQLIGLFARRKRRRPQHDGSKGKNPDEISCLHSSGYVR